MAIGCGAVAMNGGWLIKQASHYRENKTKRSAIAVRQNVRLTRSREKLQLCRPMCKSKVLENNFFVRRIACWNMLPDDVKNLSSVSQFKKALMFTDLSNSVLLK